MAKIDWIRLSGCVLICFLAGFIGSLYTTSSIPTWYASLTKPSYTPPNWLFGPVWTILYIMMGVSLYLVWQTDPKITWTKSALALFAAQLILNTSWSIVFFGLREIKWALAVIVALWILIAATIVSFKRHSQTAARLLAPYLAWVTYACALNYGILRLN
ncbi:MAG: TspO/MBR family protein [Candidatus Altiarchaeota archaeon]